MIRLASAFLKHQVGRMNGKFHLKFQAFGREDAMRDALTSGGEGTRPWGTPEVC